MENDLSVAKTTELEKKRKEKKRLQRAQEIADEVKKGYYLPASFDEMESFFPPRQVIKKDAKEIERLYGRKV